MTITASTAETTGHVHDSELDLTLRSGGTCDSVDVLISELRQSQADVRLRDRAIACSANGIFILDASQAEAPLTYVNPAFERIMGISATDALGRSLWTMFEDAEAATVIAGLRETLGEGRDAHAVLRNHRPDGRPSWTEISISPARDDTGRIAHFIGVQTDVSDRRADEETLSYLAYYDPLTKLPNRRLFHDRLTQAIAQARRKSRVTGVMFIDLDHFKRVNDRFKHSTGDLLLRLVAERLTACLRRSDTAARLGGDEFTVVLTELKRPEEATAVAQKLLSSLAEPFTIGGHQLFVGASIGIACYPDDGSDVESLLHNADTAMYHAKEHGRNIYQYFSEALNDAARERATIEDALRHALERGEFTLAYQPQVDLRSGRVLAVEALLRWRHPQFGLVPPSKFIPVAEESGLIVAIGAWVLRTACLAARGWHDAGIGLSVTVNVSGRQFRRTTLVDTVRGALTESGLAPGCLDLEFTESVVLDDAESAVEILEALKGMGCRISVDDFGTGYSSLSFLSRFPVDTLKIDRSFVSGIAAATIDRRSEAVVSSIIALAQSSRLRVIAEGVETDAQLAFLRDRRCDRMQGFHFSPPLASDAVQGFMTRRGLLSGSGCASPADLYCRPETSTPS